MRSVTLACILAGVLAGCFYDVDRSRIVDGGDTAGLPTDDPDGGGDAGAATGDVAGTLSIADGLAAGSYGVGTVYLSALQSCPAGPTMPAAIGAPLVLADQDYSAPGAVHPFALLGVPAGSVAIFAFLDVNGNADAAAPLPDTGDPLSALSCATVEVTANGIVDGVALTLDYVTP